ncbi:MAG: lysophospholipid acyltransferase family protein [Bosea sp. (in: a-proteobacteria)]
MTKAAKGSEHASLAPRWSAKARLQVTLIGMVALPLLPVQILITRFAPVSSHHIPLFFHRAVRRILGVRCVVEGRPPEPGSRALIVANHVSWLDITVIGAQQPLSFVAKSEVAGWPGIGMLAKLQDTVFIDRSRRSATAATSATMGTRLMDGDCIVLFAEGTTGDGTRIGPFRSSLLGAVKEALGPDDDGEIIVHPLTILYVGRHGIPGGRAGRALLAWYGDTELMPHLLAVLNGGPVDVRLVWGEPIAMGRDHSRKDVARLAEAAIRQTAVEQLSGRKRD